MQDNCGRQVWEKRCGPRHPELDASPETEAKSRGPGMQPFESIKNPIQVNLFGEKHKNKEIIRHLFSGISGILSANDDRHILKPFQYFIGIRHSIFCLRYYCFSLFISLFHLKKKIIHFSFVFKGPLRNPILGNILIAIYTEV